MSTLITEMKEKAGRKLLLFMGWKCCVTPECGYEVFIQWHRTLLEGKSLSVTEGGSGTSGPDPEKDTVSPCWHPSPENPGGLLPGFGHAHRHADSWPWSPAGTCISGLGCVQVCGGDTVEWLSPVFILDSQSSLENRCSSVCSLSAQPSWRFWGIPIISMYESVRERNGSCCFGSLFSPVHCMQQFQNLALKLLR